MGTPQNTSAAAPVDIVSEQGFIVTYRALEPDLCRAVIALFDRDGGKWRGRVVKPGGLAQEGEVKNSWDLLIPVDGAWQDLHRRIRQRVDACMSHYISGSPILQSFPLQVTGYKIQMYPRDEGHFQWHADAIGKDTGDRAVAMVLYLNDVAEGGETEFFHQRLKVAPKAGHLVLFPAAWEYMHCAHVPRSGDKYIIQSFVKVKD